MKKIAIITLVLAALIPAFAFADFQLGAVAMYKGDITGASGATSIALSDFTFGADVRLKLAIFQVSAAALYYPEDTVMPASLLILTDAGLSFDILFLRLGAGIGPNFNVALANVGSGTQALPLGLNLKAALDVNIGSFAIGLVGYYSLRSISDLASPDALDFAKPFFGVSLLFKLF